jgi:UDP-glucuronate decarboxylase
VHPQTESYWGNVNPVGERACYDEGKRCAETLLTDAGRRWAIDTRIVRIFNTYGPRMSFSDGRVVSNFIVQALRGAPLTIFGGGTQTRSFCFVDDLVDGVLGMSRLPGPVTSGPVNLGNPGEFTILELAQQVSKILGVKIDQTWAPLPPDDPRQRKPDITLAQKLFGFSPKVDLQTGLARTAEEFRTRLRV